MNALIKLSLKRKAVSFFFLFFFRVAKIISEGFLHIKLLAPALVMYKS